jgi:beta-galactosidase beta subunit
MTLFELLYKLNQEQLTIESHEGYLDIQGVKFPSELSPEIIHLANKAFHSNKRTATKGIYTVTLTNQVFALYQSTCSYLK